MAHDMGKIADGDERMDTLDKKMKEKYPGYDNNEEEPPIDEVIEIVREVGLEPIADAFNKAWAGEDPTPIIEAMPDAPDAEAPDLTEPADGEGEKTADETEAPAEEPEKPADEQPAEEQPKTKKSKAAKAE